MRKLAAVVVLLVAACSSAPDPEPAPPPPQPTRDPQVVQLQTSLTELLERLDVMNERLARLERSRENVGAPMSSPAPSPAPARPVPQPAAQPTPQPTVSSALRGADLAERYRSAIMLLGTNRVQEARREFQAVFDADPTSQLADNALFWIGETYFRDGDFPNAISYYRRVSEQYGDQNKAPDAVYKMGLAYARTGDLVLARQALQEVIARYPYSTPAASAKGELERIKY